MRTLLLTMERKGPAPNIISYNLVIAALVKSEQLHEAEQIYKKMSTALILPDRMTYNLMITGCLQRRQNEKERRTANRWMNRMVEANIIPDLRTFNNMILGLSKQVNYHHNIKSYEEMMTYANAAKNIYQVMTRMGHVPDTMTMNGLMKCYSLIGDEEGLNQIVSLMGIVTEDSFGSNDATTTNTNNKPHPKAGKKINMTIQPDLYTYNILIHHHLQKDQTIDAFKVYNLLSKNFDADAVTYGSFISYYIDKRDVPEALKYYDVMRRKKIMSSSVIYNILLNGYFKQPSHAEALFDRLRTMVVEDVHPDIATYNIRISHLELIKNITSETDINISHLTSIFEEMITKGHEADERTFNIIQDIDGKISPRSKNTKATIKSLLESMKDDIQPNLIRYATTIRNAAIQHDMLKAEYTFKSMVDDGIKPNIYVFAHLVWGYSQLGDLDKAEDVMNYMSESPFNIPPTAYIFAPLIEGYANAGEYEKAYSTFREMIDRGISADTTTYTILTNMFLNSSFDDSEINAIRVLEDLRVLKENDKEASNGLDQAALSVLIEAHGMAGAKSLFNINSHSDEISPLQEVSQCDYHIQSAQQVYNSIVASGAVPDPQAVTAMITALVKMQKLELAWEFWINITKPDSLIQITTYHYNALLTGFAHNKMWHPVAKHMFEEMLSESIFSDSLRLPTHYKHKRIVKPDIATFDLMLLSSALSFDEESIRRLWRHECRPKPTFEVSLEKGSSSSGAPLLIRSYYYSLTALINDNCIEEAQALYHEFCSLNTPADSASVWVKNINEMAMANSLASC
ncbi:hypothetical protein BDF14DRAFT_1727457 [Spinellus fusiger]|nr:hypothetical protein BDF14DRAFT_1727457 [Spinellus fusiger]